MDKLFEEYMNEYLSFDLEGIERELVEDCFYRQQKKIDLLTKCEDPEDCAISSYKCKGCQNKQLLESVEWIGIKIRS